MRLYVMRHGPAEDQSASGADGGDAYPQTLSLQQGSDATSAYVFATGYVGDGLRFNNPYRLATILGSQAQSLSRTATYADLGAAVVLGHPETIAQPNLAVFLNPTSRLFGRSKTAELVNRPI